MADPAVTIASRMQSDATRPPAMPWPEPAPRTNPDPSLLVDPGRMRPDGLRHLEHRQAGGRRGRFPGRPIVRRHDDTMARTALPAPSLES